MTENNKNEVVETSLVDISSNPEAFHNIVITGKSKRNLTEAEVIAGQQAIIAMALDCSGSCKKLKGAIQSALNLSMDAIKTSKGSIQVSLVKFGSTVELQPFQYANDIDCTYEPNMGGTKLYDAIYATATNVFEQIQRMEVPYDVSGGIIIVTDGEDNCSAPENRQKSIEAVHKLLNETNATVFALLLGDARNFPELIAYCEECGIRALVLKDDHEVRRALNLLTQSMSIYSDDIVEAVNADVLEQLTAIDNNE